MMCARKIIEFVAEVSIAPTEEHVEEQSRTAEAKQQT
jgi:hypothetical protein